MTGYLLDTSATLIALTDPSLLTPGVHAAILAGPNVLSVVVLWEVVLKSMKGKLAVGEPVTWWRDALDQLAARPLSLRPEHIGAVCQLPPIHQDPFDRALIAQATIEDLALVTTDGEISKYASNSLQVVQ